MTRKDCLSDVSPLTLSYTTPLILESILTLMQGFSDDHRLDTNLDKDLLQMR